jgi:hypothetical protein
MLRPMCMPLDYWFHHECVKKMRKQEERMRNRTETEAHFKKRLLNSYRYTKKTVDKQLGQMKARVQAVAKSRGKITSYDKGGRHVGKKAGGKKKPQTRYR